MLNQTLKADSVILWLSAEEFSKKDKDLPKELVALCKKGLTIEWCQDDIKSYKKLIPALQKYPNDIIITFDDDMILHEKTVELLYSCYKKHPKDIISHRVTRLYYNYIDSGKLEILINDCKYKSHNDYVEVLKGPSYFNKLCGVAGVLYPPKCLFSPDVLDKNAFLTLAPTSDDIWFWCMAVRNKTRVRVPKVHFPEQEYIPGTQEVALWRINDQGPKNFFIHLNNILNAYPDMKNIMDEDKIKNDRIIRSLTLPKSKFRRMLKKLLSTLNPLHYIKNFKL